MIQVTRAQRALAHHVVRTIRHTLEKQLHLQPVFREYVITQSNSGTVILFAVLDTRRMEGKLAPYTRLEVLHQISTNLKGRPVAVSNSSGLRLAVPLNKPAPLPSKAAFPGVVRGKLLVGLRTNRQVAAIPWEKTLNLLVAGQTGSGKSTFLRLLVYQAIADGQQLLIGDRHRTTLPMLNGHPNMLEPIAKTPDEYWALVKRGRKICEEREALYAQCPAYPEKLSEYNAWAVRNGREALPRVLVILEEYNATLVDLGGATGKFGQAVKVLVMEGRKFGVTVVIASQAFEKSALGALRSQIGTVIVLRTLDGATARNLGVAQAARIPPNRPGRAATNHWGMVQTFYLPKAQLIDLNRAGQQSAIALSEQERALMRFAWEQMDGRVSIPKLVSWAQEMGWGVDWSRYKAEQRAREWELRGWVRKDPRRDNARYVTKAFAEKLGFSPETRKPLKPPETA